MPARASVMQAGSGMRATETNEPSEGREESTSTNTSTRSKSMFVGSTAAGLQASAAAANAQPTQPAPERLKRFIVCQKCRRPFRLLPTAKLTSKADSSFAWIEDTAPIVMSYEQAQVIAANLFQYASEKTNVDMPLCRECNDSVGWGPGGINESYNSVKKEHQAYAGTLRTLDEEGLGITDGASTDDTQQLQAEEAELEAALKRIEEETAQLDAEQAQTDLEAREVRSDAEDFWSHVSELTVAERTLGDVLDHLSRKALVSQAELERLGSIHLLNEGFNIWHCGHFGTINTFRLGRLPSQPVEPIETNAAWGLAAQLLTTLLPLWGVSTSRYQVIPKGSFSTVMKLGSKSAQKLELWMGAPGLWASTRHDNAMTGFACCLDELCKHCLMMCPNDSIPYPMDEDRIGGLSVKISSSSQTDEKWTRALKFLLLNLKWVVTMTASHMAD